MYPESEIEAIMRRLSDEVREQTLEIVAQHLERKAQDHFFDGLQVYVTWHAAAREVRAIAQDARNEVAR